MNPTDLLFNAGVPFPLAVRYLSTKTLGDIYIMVCSPHPTGCRTRLPRFSMVDPSISPKRSERNSIEIYNTKNIHMS